jgi:hypothetical protein
MAQRRERARIQRGALTAEEAEKLFATVDETGHTNEETARKQRKRRKEVGQGVDVDPLSDADPSGSNVEKVITKTAVGFVVIFLAIVVVSQVTYGFARRASTANLAEAANVTNVASALRGGVEWGNGFTQFPEVFSVQEADENTHRIEVTVTDTSSKDALEAFAGSQIQATALAVNSLLNPNINTLIYHVNVHVGDDGKYETSQLFGFLKPKGEIKTIMTFIWTKATTESGGVRFNCTITGVDQDMQEQLRENVTSSFTPSAILSSVLGDDKTGRNSDKTSDKESATASKDATKTDAAATSADNATADAAATTEGSAEAASAQGAAPAADASAEGASN